MNYRTFGRTGWQVSEIGFGACAIGADWGPVDDRESLDALRAALDAGMNFIDTADVYGDGRSERLIAQVLKERRERVYVATKAGRRLNPHVAGAAANLACETARPGWTLDLVRSLPGPPGVPCRKSYPDDLGRRRCTTTASVSCQKRSSKLGPNVKA
jgi:aryl-alcohol dehydrogenase-like predicted oxidoreductase